MRARLLGLFLLSTGVMLLLARMTYSWSRWIPEACALRNCYCEPFRTGYFVLQPFTAFSNLGYILAGMLVLSFKKQLQKTSPQNPNPMVVAPTWIIGYGVTLNLTGWFSFFSHASLTRVGEWFDLMGVYLLLCLLLIYNLKRAGVQKQPLRNIYALLILGLGIQMIWIPQWQQICIVLLLTTVLAAEAWVRLKVHPAGNNRYYLGAVALFAVGAAIWGANGRAPVCAPGSFPWHIAWHLLSATAAYVLFRYYFTEKPGPLTARSA
jgi:hypothetical protein